MVVVGCVFLFCAKVLVKDSLVIIQFLSPVRSIVSLSVSLSPICFAKPEAAICVPRFRKKLLNLMCGFIPCLLASSFNIAMLCLQAS